MNMTTAQNIQDISDTLPLYKIKKYRFALELMNDNVPLSMVKRRLHNKHMMEMAGEVFKKEKKQINRKCAIIDSELKKRAFKVVIVDPKSDKLCDKCEYNPNYHPYGCNLNKLNPWM
jgi:hypothetical protein